MTAAAVLFLGGVHTVVFEEPLPAVMVTPSGAQEWCWESSEFFPGPALIVLSQSQHCS